VSDANRTTFAIVEEQVLGTTPDNPVWERIRITGGGLKAAPKTTESAELSADLNVIDNTLVGIEPTGTAAVEMVYKNIDTPLEGLMRSRWAGPAVRDNNGVADSVITDVTATDMTVLATAGTKINSGVVAPGHLVLTTGFTAPNNNAIRRAGAGTTGTDLKLAGGTVEAVPPGTARAKVVGFEGVAGDITAGANGLLSTALDFTTLGLVLGQWLKIGGALAGQQFSGVAAKMHSCVSRPSLLARSVSTTCQRDGASMPPRARRFASG
jgi:hypothetical protein